MQLVFTKAFLLLSLSVLPFVFSEDAADKKFEYEFSESKKANGKSHNLIVGQPSSTDRLLLDMNVYVPRKILRVVTKEIKFPTGSQYGNTISSVQCWDGKSDGTGAYPIIKQGGIGWRNVTILFKSQRSHGIHFNVKIYGKRYYK